MKPFISLKAYGIINWIVVVLLLAAPWNFGSWHPGFYQVVGGAALFIPIFFGWTQFIMAVFSDNSHGFIRQFPMQMHLFLDIIQGSFLFFSPLVYGFYTQGVYLPHVLIGALMCFVAIFTQKSPFTVLTEPSHPLGQLHGTASQESRLDH